MQTETGRGYLAARVKARRGELGLTAGDIAARGGPAHSTLSKIENARTAGSYRPAVLRSLDQALEWVPGSATGCLSGREPMAIGGTGGGYDWLFAAFAAMPAPPQEKLELVYRLLGQVLRELD